MRRPRRDRAQGCSRRCERPRRRPVQSLASAKPIRRSPGKGRGPRLLLLAGLGLFALASSGCAATFWEDATAVSPTGKFKDTMALRWGFLTHKIDPMETLATSSDGDMRARAFRMLKEPKQTGGAERDQDYLVEMLASACKTEKQVICRVAAVEKLGEFKDPRAVKALTEAFYAPINFSDKNPVVRTACLTSLGRIGDPAGLETLSEAAMRDPSMDVRIAAATALGHFKDYQA